MAIKMSPLACVLAFGLISGTTTCAFAEDAPKVPQAAPAAPAASAPPQTEAAKEAEKKLGEEDPTKIVKKPDAATTVASADPATGMQLNGMWVDKDGNPTPHVSKDGTLDWFTFSGYRRYGANCLVCHGPDALGSSYAPALMDSLKTITYPEFLQTVAAGKQQVSNSSNLVMPSFGDNKNVQCYINDIYTYIRARSLGLMDRERPTKHEDKPEIYATAETACLGF